MYICKVCKKEFDGLDGLRRHNSRVHKISSQNTYDEYVLDNIIPTCKCGCGEIPSFNSFTHGYRTYMYGHLPRVVNNWGHNKKAQEKSAETRRQQYASGERVGWCNGLTMETDDRVRKLAEKTKATINSDSVELKRRSDQMREHRLNGTVPTRWGKDSANWKGGTSSINNLVRANKRLYTEWIYPILKRDNFKCTECGSIVKLEVHHTDEQMSDILHKLVDKTDNFTFDEKREKMNEIIDYHIDNNVQGKTLCNECHKQLHPSYNT